MKISAREGEPGYCVHLFRVELNGSEIADVATADEEAGVLMKYVRDTDGRHILNEARTAAVLAEVRGRVVVHVLGARRHG